ALGQKSRFVFRNLFVFGLVVVVLGKLSDSLFIPSGGICLFFSWSLLFPPLASAKRSLRPGHQVEGRDNEYTVANSVWHVNNLRIPPRRRLTEAYPRSITARGFFSGPTQGLPHFFLSDTMIENVRQIGFWIYTRSAAPCRRPFRSTPPQFTSHRTVLQAARRAPCRRMKMACRRGVQA